MITTRDIETIITGGGIAYSTDGEEIGPCRKSISTPQAADRHLPGSAHRHLHHVLPIDAGAAGIYFLAGGIRTVSMR